MTDVYADVEGFHEGDRAFLDLAAANGWQAYVIPMGDSGPCHRCIADRPGERVFMTTGFEKVGQVTVEHLWTPEHPRGRRHRWVDPGRVGDVLRSVPR